MTPATCSLSFEWGSSTRSCRAIDPLRMRVSMSAMGSVIMGSPARLHDARDLAPERQHAETNSAKRELAIERPRSTAHLAPVAVADRELGPAIEFRKLRG